MPLSSLISEYAPSSAMVASWLLTYWLHSGFIIGLVWCLSLLLRSRALDLQDMLWKVALIGALATASLQVGFHLNSMGPRLVLPVMPVAEALPQSLESSMVEPASQMDRAGQGEMTASAQRVDPGEATPPGESGAGSVSGARSAGWIHSLGSMTFLNASGVDISRPAGLITTATHWVGRLELKENWPSWVIQAWLFIAACLGIHMVAGLLEIRRRLALRREISNGAARETLDRLLRRESPGKRVRLTASANLQVPVALGIFKPEVCLPERALTDLSHDQLKSILAHELAHLLRRDQVWLLAGRLLEGIFFFQPLGRLVRRKLHEVAELLCDDFSIRATGQRLSMARCLTEVAGWMVRNRELNTLPGILGKRSILSRRIAMILDETRIQKRERRPIWLLPLIFAVLALAVVAAPGVVAYTESPQTETPAVPDLDVADPVVPDPERAGTVAPIDAMAPPLPTVEAPPALAAPDRVAAVMVPAAELIPASDDPAPPAGDRMPAGNQPSVWIPEPIEAEPHSAVPDVPPWSLSVPGIRAIEEIEQLKEEIRLIGEQEGLSEEAVDRLLDVIDDSLSTVSEASRRQVELRAALEARQRAQDRMRAEQMERAEAMRRRAEELTTRMEDRVAENEYVRQRYEEAYAESEAERARRLDEIRDELDRHRENNEEEKAAQAEFRLQEMLKGQEEHHLAQEEYRQELQRILEERRIVEEELAARRLEDDPEPLVVEEE